MNKVTTETGLITGEELFEMGEIGPCELVKGKIIPTSPTGGRHGWIEFRLGAQLTVFVEEHQLGYVVGGEVGVYTGRDPDTVRGMDVAFFSEEQLPEGVPTGFIEAVPELIVEVMSPGDRWSEVQEKLEEYFALGVTWVWVVRPQDREVWLFHSPADVQKLGEDDILKGEGMLEGFNLPVSVLFAY
ncbi:MAG: Uma2 family endonuclease [Chloroflexota bacterium]|nr:Uma2 family endonuclease [Chloroflexota bacterium]